MAKNTGPPESSGQNVRDLDDGNANTRVLLLKLGEQTAEIKNLVKAMEKQGAALETLNTKAIQLDTTVKVGGTLLVVFFGLFWWMFGQHVEALVQGALREVVLESGRTSEAPPAEQ